MFKKLKKQNKEGHELGQRIMANLTHTWSPAKLIVVRLCVLSVFLTTAAYKIGLLVGNGEPINLIGVIFGWIPGCYLFTVFVHPMAKTKTDRFLVALSIPAQVSITIWFLLSIINK